MIHAVGNAVRAARAGAALTGCVALVLAASASPETEYRSLKAFSEQGPPAGTVRRSPEETAWFTEKGIQIHERGVKFWEDYPRDPLRWDVWVLLRVPPMYRRELDANGKIQYVMDRERLTAWRILDFQRLEQLLEAPDASDRARQNAFNALIILHTNGPTIRTKTPEGQAVLTKVLGLFDRFQREYPQSLMLINGARRIAEILDRLDALQAQRFLLGLINRYSADTDRDRALREMAEGRLKLVLGQAYPVWLRLAALDGRFVDTQEYRGKLVLIAVVPLSWGKQIDFMRGLHSTYHPQGLEIIQVTGGDSARAGDAPRTALQTALEVDEEQLPWRVAWDRKGTIGEFSRSLGKNSYPAWLLISRDSRFVAETDTGAELTRAIERELALKAE